MAAHRYWRVYITAVNTKADGSTGLREIQFRETVGGASVLSGGTASAESSYGGSWLPENAVDGNTGTEWVSGVEGVPHWWKYDFGVGNEKDIVEMAWVPRADIQQEPVDFQLQWSDNDVDWTTLYTVTGFWEQNRYTTDLCVLNADFAPTAGAAAFQAWRINITANDGHFGACAFTEIEFRAFAGGPNQCAGGSVYCSSFYDGIDPPHWPDAAVDGVTTYPPSLFSFNTTFGWWAYKFPAPVGVRQIAITTRGDNSWNQAPKTFTIEYWDGSSWQVAHTEADSSGWTAGETRTYTVPNVDGQPALPNTNTRSRMSVTRICL